MSSIRSKDTRPELVVRKLLHRLGFRFRLHKKGLPGKPDLVLTKHKTVVLIHGCFWHGCRKCDRGKRVPKTNTKFWVDKIAENCRRDQDVVRALTEAGWKVNVVWACETENIKKLQDTLIQALAPMARATPAKPLGR